MTAAADGATPGAAGPAESSPSDPSGGGTSTAEAGRRLVDEALRFVEALRAPTAGPGPAATGTPSGFEGLFGPGPDGGPTLPQHTGPECRACPVCRVITAVRTLRPEAVEHLALAAAELANAWREVVAGGTPASPPPSERPREPSVERIDVTD